MTAINSLLAGLFDYAGLYPPASLGLRSAANNYVEYVRSVQASSLGRFIINIDRLDEFRSTVGEYLGQFRISVVLTDPAGLDVLAKEIRRGMPIETVEMKCTRPEEIEEIARRIPQQLAAYFEVPINAEGRVALSSIARVGARAKIRMGGISPEAIPQVPEVAQTLAVLAELRLPFKATAGLHHPVRSSRALTYKPQSPKGTMHGFMNLCCAAAVLYFGGKAGDAEKLLHEEDATTWQVSTDAIQWRHLKWRTDQLAELRRDFVHSIGSCSFVEPMHDLESLGWL